MIASEAEAEAARERFWGAAWAESARLLEEARRERGAPVDPLEAGVSLCVPSGDDDRAIRARMRRRALIGVQVGMGGLLLGAACAMAARRLPSVKGLLLGIGGACTLSGMAALFVPTWRDRVELRHRIAARHAGAWADADARYGAWVFVEDPRTVERLKAVAEDLALVVVHEDPPCAVVEGLGARCVIHRDDVTSWAVRTVGKSRWLVLAYRVGSTEMQLALKEMGVAGELLAQVLGRCSIAKRMAPALPA